MTRRLLLSLGVIAITPVFAASQSRGPSAADRVITSNAVGPVRVGMTVAQASGFFPAWKLESRSGDGYTLALVAGKDTVMYWLLDAAFESAPAERARIAIIGVCDPTFSTRSGVRPGMSVRDAAPLLPTLSKGYRLAGQRTQPPPADRATGPILWDFSGLTANVARPRTPHYSMSQAQYARLTPPAPPVVPESTIGCIEVGW